MDPLKKYEVSIYTIYNSLDLGIVQPQRFAPPFLAPPMDPM